ncbi:protein FAM47E-like [Hemicordylus capensis]|uniref:protein FAM47E-like n=1 Tax=Hemicordylus capensis TaxID=884348 RepID=UPI0023027E97|nr:protein FAM47E-like [Hemicordylus capensis]
MSFKCFQKHSLNKSRLSDSLNSQRWRFLQNNLDDFRGGIPPPCDSIVTHGTKGPAPVILTRKPEGPHKTQQRAKRMLAVPQSCTSKLSPMLQARKDGVAQVEYCLSQHPLALYPHLEESIPLELFKEVMGILDPEMLPLSGDAAVEEEHCILSSMQSQPGDKRNRQTKPKSYSWKEPQSKDPYTWFSKKEVATRAREARLNYVPPLDESVTQSIKDFCSWFDSLGGEKYDIDEATISSLFDTGYETKPPLSVPIHVVELNDLPADLRKYGGMPQATMKNISEQGDHSKESCQPKWEKIRYGAWYLDPKTWKKQKANEPLEDPKSEDTRIKNSRKSLGEKDAEIMKLHGTRAFKEFLDKKGYRIPEFLQQMLDLQDEVGTKGGMLNGSRSELLRCKGLGEDSPARTVN